MDKKENLNKLKSVISNIEKSYGKGSIMMLGKKDIDSNIDVYSTGSLGLDIALGIGGVPKGRVIEVYGPESSGKTTLTLHIIAEAQKMGGHYIYRHLRPSYFCKEMVMRILILSFVQFSFLAGKWIVEVGPPYLQSGEAEVVGEPTLYSSV